MSQFSQVLNAIRKFFHFKQVEKWLFFRSYTGEETAIDDSIICAGLLEGDDMKGACDGDMGSPLICDCGTNGEMQVIGIMSTRVAGCADTGFPDIYTSASYFVDWIIETMASFA